MTRAGTLVDNTSAHMTHVEVSKNSGLKGHYGTRRKYADGVLRGDRRSRAWCHAGLHVLQNLVRSLAFLYARLSQANGAKAETRVVAQV